MGTLFKKKGSKQWQVGVECQRTSSLQQRPHDQHGVARGSGRAVKHKYLKSVSSSPKQMLRPLKNGWPISSDDLQT
jgi:hypothetical protein